MFTHWHLLTFMSLLIVYFCGCIIGNMWKFANKCLNEFAGTQNSCNILFLICFTDVAGPKTRNKQNYLCSINNGEFVLHDYNTHFVCDYVMESPLS